MLNIGSIDCRCTLPKTPLQIYNVGMAVEKWSSLGKAGTTCHVGSCSAPSYMYMSL